MHAFIPFLPDALHNPDLTNPGCTAQDNIPFKCNYLVK